MTTETEVHAAAELALKADKNTPVTHLVTDDGHEFLIYRQDFRLNDVTPTNKAPVLRPQIVIQEVQVQTTESFVEYTNRMKNDDSVIFADMVSSSILGVIDYHQSPEANKTGEITAAGRNPTAEHTEHTVRLNLPHSLEWNTWMAYDGKLMSHKDFATFLEENAQDVLPLPKRPGLATSEEDADMPETLLELTRSLQAASKVSFNSVVRHGDYERVEFSKESDASTKGGLGLPVSFDILIPVYFGEASVRLTCFTRKKIEDGVLRIGFKVNRAENVRQDEFQRIVGAIAGSTSLTTLFGKPNA